ncbi:hypothetical protein EYF80_033560 [Liparis tanakae]|uniref:Uncharacterized protein n=1 Tax=Liparis tanakae TaxID=230148 RepID=A0A4Z2GUA2_9TELE|nr:hypothetical protein EYF80_033560 [Liparis tanakae]
MSAFIRRQRISASASASGGLPSACGAEPSPLSLAFLPMAASRWSFSSALLIWTEEFKKGQVHAN